MKVRKPISGRSNVPGRSAKAPNRPDQSAAGTTPYATKDGRHPGWGALKGSMRLVPGVDLIEPAFPDFEKVWLEANAWWLDDPKLNPKR
jgi:hypothetical protein